MDNKKAAILVEVISTLGALASILWLFLDPGPEPFAASLVCLAIILGSEVQAQVKLAKILDESLSVRIHSIREIKGVVDNIPRATADELHKKLNSDNELRNWGIGLTQVTTTYCMRVHGHQVLSEIPR